MPKFRLKIIGCRMRFLDWIELDCTVPGAREQCSRTVRAYHGGLSTDAVSAQQGQQWMI